MGCEKSEKEIDTPLYNTNLDSITESIIESKNSGKTFVFNSKGGRTSTALKVADLMNMEVNLTVNVECTSNCAELIIPSAKSIVFKDNPIIGFHGNTNSYQFYVENFAERDQHFCNWAYAIEERNIQEKRGLNLEFWKEQMAQLEPSINFRYVAGKCPWRLYNFKNHLWLPSSEQLRELWGLDFEGQVCADRIESCKKRANRRWEKGTRIVIGDEVYVSEGK